MPEWLWGSIVAAAGIVGYWLRGLLDEWFVKRRTLRADREHQRQVLRTFLGTHRAHYEWLEVFASTRQRDAGPTGESLERGQSIADWVTENAHSFPRAARGSMYLISNTSQHLSAGHRLVLELASKDGRDGYVRLYEAWEALERYEEELTRQLTSSRRPPLL